MKTNMLFLNENPGYKVDEKRSVVFQPMHGDNIDYKIGPLVVEFTSRENRDLFFTSKIGEFKAAIDRKYGADFQPVHAVDADRRDGDMEA